MTQPVSGTTTASPTGTYTVAYGAGTFPVSGTVTASPTGTYTTTADYSGPIGAGTAPAKAAVTGLVYNTAAPGPTNGQAVALQGDSAGNLKVNVAAGSVTSTPSGTYTVAYGSGTFPVSGTVTASPTGTYTVAGTTTATPSGTYTVAYGSGTFPVSGTVTASPTGTYTVAGTVTTSPTEVATGIVCSYGTSAAVASASTGTITYSVTAGKTAYLKEVIAASSGGPCKVVVDYGATPTVICVAFYSAASPTVVIPFDQPISIAATTAINIKITNSCGLSQDVYGTIILHEV